MLVEQTQGTIIGPVAFGLASRGPNWRVENDSLDWMIGTQGFNSCHCYFPLGIRHGTISGKIEFTGGIKIGRIVWHTQARRDALILTYYLDEDLVSLARGSLLLGVFSSPKGPKPFLIRYGADADWIEPVPGQAFPVTVVDDVPSGFGFEGRAYKPEDTASSVRISNLKIELSD